MKVPNTLVALLVAFSACLSHAGTAINTIGSSDGVAIKGFDPVAFFTLKKATPGDPNLTYEWSGAKWQFASDENLQQFKQDPEKFAPQYGGHCAYGMSEGYVSRKPTNGDFEIMNDKLYLFPAGDHRGSTRDAWWRYGAGPKRRIADADRNWPRLKADLEAK
jgi:YHS domain-containing protein